MSAYLRTSIAILIVAFISAMVAVGGVFGQFSCDGPFLCQTSKRRRTPKSGAVALTTLILAIRPNLRICDMSMAIDDRTRRNT